MSGWETLNCENHPERIALERCEVCHKPLCAYCLYYTEDGQRLCAEHAEEARLLGAKIQDPGSYAEQLIGAQIGATRKEARGRVIDDDTLYHGNSHDLMAALGLLLSLFGLSIFTGIISCLPLAGVLMSLAALLNAKNAFDPKRTRRLAISGLVVSAIWLLIVGGCMLSVKRSLTDASGGQWCNFGGVYVISPGGGGGSNTTATPGPSPMPPDPPTFTPEPATSVTPTE
ncbi:MAG: B-box zinc finger protein [Anaerolineae bacterium]|nr:B-box zinc finger protein [Anaerolineae bacterium]